MRKTEKQRVWKQAKPLFRQHGIHLDYRKASLAQIVDTYKRLRSLQPIQPKKPSNSVLRQKHRIPAQPAVPNRGRTPCYWATNLVAGAQQKGVNDLVSQQRAFITSVEPPSPSELVQTHWQNYILSVEQLRDFVEHVRCQQQRSFKFNLSLGLVLYYPAREQFQLVDATKSDLHFFDKERPPLITSQADLQSKVMRFLNAETILKKFNYPESNSQIVGVWQASAQVYLLDYPASANPSFDRVSRFCVSPVINHNMCFWGCLAMVLHSANPQWCKRKALTLFRDFYGPDEKPATYEGFRFKSELEAVEAKFSINLFVYQERTFNEEDDKRSTTQTILVNTGAFKYPKERNVNLLLTGGIDGQPLHLLWIKQCDRFLQRLACKFCGKLVKDAYALKRHEKKASCMERETFPKVPHVYNPPSNKMEEFLQKWHKSAPSTNSDSGVLPFGIKYFATFDYESLLETVIPTEEVAAPKKLQIRQKHIPLSVSVYSNVPGYEQAEFMWSRDPVDLNKRFYTYLVDMAAKAKELEEERFNIDHDVCQGKQGEQFDKLFMFPVVGFNSGGYDLLLNKNYGLYHLFAEDGIDNPIKKGKQYLMLRLTGSGISFFDMMQYSAPGTNLDKYMKSWGQKCGKMIFPYKFLRSYENLEQKEFPAYEEFTSDLTGQKLDPEVYTASKAAYDADPAMHCFLDYLRAYNNSDVEPFFKAVLQQQRWFAQQGLDIFRDGLTLSSHANKIMCRFPLRDADKLTEADLQQLPVPAQIQMSDAKIEQRIAGYKEQDRQRRSSLVSSSSSSSLCVEVELPDEEAGSDDDEESSDGEVQEDDVISDEETNESEESKVYGPQEYSEYVGVQDVRQTLARPLLLLLGCSHRRIVVGGPHRQQSRPLARQFRVVMPTLQPKQEQPTARPVLPPAAILATWSVETPDSRH